MDGRALDVDDLNHVAHLHLHLDLVDDDAAAVAQEPGDAVLGVEPGRSPGRDGGLGGLVTDPTAAAGQAQPAYLFAHSFAFAASSAWGVVGLVDDPAGKFAVLDVIDPQGGSHPAAVPFAWAPGRLYFVVVYQLAPGTWGAWVYDHTAATWVGIGQLSLPAAWGKRAPTTGTAAVWYGTAPTACAAYPRADVLFHPPTGFVGTTPLTATLDHTTQAGGDCPTDTSVEQGVWAGTG